jgi:hypothetical protein
MRRVECMDTDTYRERFRAHDVDWAPLERFFCGAEAPEIAAFGFAGHWDRTEGDSIRMYMNLDTRQLLMVDDQLECYRLSGKRVKRISRQAAIAAVYAGINDVELHELRAVPRPGVFQCRHNNWGADAATVATARVRHLRVVS